MMKLFHLSPQSSSFKTWQRGREGASSDLSSLSPEVTARALRASLAETGLQSVCFGHLTLIRTQQSVSPLVLRMRHQSPRAQACWLGLPLAFSDRAPDVLPATSKVRVLGLEELRLAKLVSELPHTL